MTEKLFISEDLYKYINDLSYNKYKGNSFLTTTISYNLFSNLTEFIKEIKNIENNTVKNKNIYQELKNSKNSKDLFFLTFFNWVKCNDDKCINPTIITIPDNNSKLKLKKDNDDNIIFFEIFNGKNVQIPITNNIPEDIKKKNPETPTKKYILPINIPQKNKKDEMPVLPPSSPAPPLYPSSKSGPLPSAPPLYPSSTPGPPLNQSSTQVQSPKPKTLIHTSATETFEPQSNIPASNTSTSNTSTSPINNYIQKKTTFIPVSYTPTPVSFTQLPQDFNIDDHFKATVNAKKFNPTKSNIVSSSSTTFSTQDPITSSSITSISAVSSKSTTNKPIPPPSPALFNKSIGEKILLPPPPPPEIISSAISTNQSTNTPPPPPPPEIISTNQSTNQSTNTPLPQQIISSAISTNQSVSSTNTPPPPIILGQEDVSVVAPPIKQYIGGNSKIKNMRGGSDPNCYVIPDLKEYVYRLLLTNYTGEDIYQNTKKCENANLAGKEYVIIPGTIVSNASTLKVKSTNDCGYDPNILNPVNKYNCSNNEMNTWSNISTFFYPNYQLGGN